MRTCSIEHCDKGHEAKGYCKNHYKSFLHYGDPLHIENAKKQRALDKEEQLRNKEQKRIDRQNQPNVCMVDGCEKGIYAKFLCKSHYTIVKGLGSGGGKLKKNVIETDTCLVLGCNNIHVRHGFCKSHLTTINELKTPYRVKIVKYCAIEGCNAKHFGNGLCQKHYNQWNRIVKKYNLNEYVNLTD